MTAPTDSRAKSRKGEQAFELDSPASFGGVLRGVVQTPQQPGPRPTVVVCHGFKGFFERGFFPVLADLLVERGYTVIRFNFSGTGMRPGDLLVTDMDAFRRNTFSLERDEALRVLEHAPELAPGRVDTERMALFGHSRGGAVSLLTAAEEPWRSKLRALVTWGSLESFDLFRTHADQLRRDGTLEIVNQRTGQTLILGTELLDDLEGHPDRLDLHRAAAARTAPWLIVHGDEDESVPVAHAHALSERAAPEHRLEIVPGGDHNFGIGHPFHGPTPHLVQALNATQDWLRKHCW